MREPNKQDHAKEERRKAIIEIIQDDNYFNQGLIAIELQNRGFNTKQGTVSRDIKELKIIKGPEGYKISEETKKKNNQDLLQKLLQTNNYQYYRNVSYKYLKVEKGTASQIAALLQETYPDVILDMDIGINHIIMLVNLDADANDFFHLLEHQ